VFCHASKDVRDRAPALSAKIKPTGTGIHAEILLNERQHDSGLCWGDKPKTKIINLDEIEVRESNTAFLIE
jgi:hypothetical protein